ncbi:MAG: hypothetical protein AAGF27_10440 [Pseudomonadota bacterium]
MTYFKSALAVAALVASATAAGAAGHTITDQSYKGGKAGAGGSVPSASLANPLAGCPVEQREMYRGNLYCRDPLLAVNAPRSPLCPDGFYGLYLGNVICTRTN